MAKAQKPLPHATRWLLAFQGFNAMNFTLALGAPLVLSARYIGATEAQIGLLTTLMPLLVGLQLTATRAIGRFGCRRVMIFGWTMRSFFLLLIAPLPLLLGRVSGEVLVALLMLGMLGFTATRGFAGAGWFPWLKHLIPEDQRGQFLGSEQRIINISAFLTLIATGFFLGEDPESWRYGTIFVVAWGAGMASALMLYRVPETGAGLQEFPARPSFTKLKATIRKVWSHKPLRRMIQFTGMFNFAVMAQPVFLVLYLKEQLEYSEGVILKLQAAATLGVLLTAVYWGQLSDRIGSRPLMRIFDLGIFGVFAFWAAASLGMISPSVVVAYAVFFVGGVFVSAHGVSNSRLVLGSCPRNEVTFSLALFAVISSICGGAAPVLFGVLLGAIRETDAVAGPASLSFSVLFVIFLALGGVSQILLTRVPEMGRMPTRKVLMQVAYGWPLRVLSGVWGGGSKRKP